MFLLIKHCLLWLLCVMPCLQAEVRFTKIDRHTVNRAERKLYSIRWFPYAADWWRYTKNWIEFGTPIHRYLRPDEIHEAAVLIAGNKDNVIYGESLWEEKCWPVYPYLKEVGHYSWVLNNEREIIFGFNAQRELKARNYTRHSDFAGGKSIPCAGEFYAKNFTDSSGMYLELNDSSGHYFPEGNLCLEDVQEELARLGIQSVISGIH